ncbi:MAG: L-serine ammonia-lyase, iron-sulfur-dependent, subunit alpha [Desulfobacterales bacterium]|nr:L-serine ammonia-lyase, iron-sulfur-dependent, subunit alpha [Desulfobacterales bacterium]
MISPTNELISILKKEVVPATGCTEPIAVAYAASVAGKMIEDLSKIVHIDVCVDPGLFKNGLRVGIPGIKERGLEIAAALGLIVAKPEKELRVLEAVTPEENTRGEAMVKSGVIALSVKGNCNRLFVEVLVTLHDGSQIKVVTLDRHNNIVQVQEGKNLKHEAPESISIQASVAAIQNYDLMGIMDFCLHTKAEALSFLHDGIAKNMALAKEGLSYEGGIGKAYDAMIEEGILNSHMVTRAEMYCAAASEARMSGSILPAMSSAGSGNHGITVFLTIAAVADVTQRSFEEVSRALAFANLITVYIKSYTGTLSAMCGCGVAAGIGASAGVAFLLGANEQTIFKSMVNMVGSITGLICDGGKEGCAYKLALSAGWAVKAALLAIKGVSVHENNGILANSFKTLFENLGLLCNEGMAAANTSILTIMEKQLKAS